MSERTFRRGRGRPALGGSNGRWSCSDARFHEKLAARAQRFACTLTSAHPHLDTEPRVQWWDLIVTMDEPGLFGSSLPRRARTFRGHGEVRRGWASTTGTRPRQAAVWTRTTRLPAGRIPNHPSLTQKRLPQAADAFSKWPAKNPGADRGSSDTVRYKNRTLQIPADRHRHHYVKAQTTWCRCRGRTPPM